jgi:hypothetical protein
MSSLNDQLSKLGLRVRNWDRGDKIFALDIVGDSFFIQEGEGNQVHIQASDKKLGQAVLMVHELPREFELTIPKNAVGPRDRVIKELKYNRVLIARTTPDETRHILVGRDERGHPFATQLRGPSISVKQAHESLKPEAIQGQRVGGKGKNYKKRGKKTGIKRQGEWFFTPVDQNTQRILNTQYWVNLIEKKVPIEPFHDGSSARAVGGKVRQRRGNPHTADEVLVYTGGKERVVYVRGAVRHAEHDTLKFNHWVKVDRNREVVGSSAISWID